MNDDPELEAFAGELAGLRAVAAPLSLRRDLRGALLAAPVVATAQRRSWLVSLRPLLAAVVALAVLVGTAGSAAAGTLPGDALFGLKRAVEDVQVTLAPTDDARLDLLVAQTDRRLGDLEAVAAHHSNALGVATDEYLKAVERLDHMIDVVVSEPVTPARFAALERARADAATHVDRLRVLAGTLPAQALPGIQRAIDAGETIRGNSGDHPQPSAVPSAQPSDRTAGPSEHPGADRSDVHPTPPAPPTHR